MEQIDNGKMISLVTIDNQSCETRLEKILPPGTDQEVFRFSTWANGSLISQPLMLSEENLVLLLHRAIHARVLSQDFISKLRQKIEI